MGEERPGRETGALIRLHIVVEGQTEESFVNEVLALELGAHGIFIDAHRMTTGRKHGSTFRGGWDSYKKLQRDLALWMKQDQSPDARFSTMVDLYGLPLDFPGYEDCRLIVDPDERVECLEDHLGRDVNEQLGGDWAHRFIPYIQLHEFEALLFADPRRFLAAFPEADVVIERLQEIRAKCGGPERIDAGDTTAPSKRILQLLPEYSKVVSGVVIVKQIGLGILRQECPHFGKWIAKLLDLAPHAT